MNDFWVACGHHLLDRDADGRLVLTDEFLKAYLARPELVPPEDACEAELRLHHELLMHDPRREVRAEEIVRLADADARENWELLIGFRDRLMVAPTLEAAYLSIAREPRGIPPLFLNQLTQVVLRNALDGEEDAFVLRAAELLFRPQRVTFHEGAVLLADAEAVEVHESERGQFPLLRMLGGPAVTEFDVVNEENATKYAQRSDAFDMVLNLSTERARQALAHALQRFLRHLLGVETAIEPVSAMEDPDWAWFVGLDQEGTRIGDALWKGAELDADTLARVLALFRLRFANEREALPRVGAKPVWLILGMTPDKLVRLKPQNLIVGLPHRAAEPVS